MKKTIFFLPILLFLSIMLGAGWNTGDSGWKDPYSFSVGKSLYSLTYNNDAMVYGETYVLPASGDGLGIIKGSTCETLFTTLSDGTVLISGNTGSISGTSENDKLVIFRDTDNCIKLRNNIGTSQKVKMIYFYN